MTEFKVLISAQEGEWVEAGEVEAHNAEAACKASYMKNPRDILAIVAVPKRSFRPTPIRVETTKRVVLGSLPGASGQAADAPGSGSDGDAPPGEGDASSGSPSPAPKGKS